MKKNKLLFETALFFCITLFVTWVLWLPSVLNTMGFKVPVILLIIAMMASFTPTIVGLILDRRYHGKDAFKQIMKDRLSWRYGYTANWNVPVQTYIQWGRQR